MIKPPLFLRSLTLVLLSVGSLTAQTAPAETSEGGMNWSFTPYVWASDTSVDATVHDEAIGSSEIKFSDLVDKLEYGFQGHLEGHGSQLGFFADVTYMAISDDIDQHGFSVDAEMKTGIYELAVVKNLSGEGAEGFSLFAGVRHLTGDQKIELQDNSNPGLQHKITEDNAWTDFMIGARYVQSLSEKWEFGLRGDYANGDTEGALNIQALFGRKMKRGTAILGYRHFEFDLKEGALDAEYTLSGPVIGMRFDL